MDDISNTVTLMTLHSAKGLEFPIVFLAGLEEGIFPHQRTFNNNSELEEERRLMYVGITRAQEVLYLTSARRRQFWGEFKYYNPSRFLEEIPQELLDRNEADDIDMPRQQSTFRSAIDKIRFNKKPEVKSDNYGYVKPSSGFGKNFVAPSKKSAPIRTANKILVKKSANNLAREKERVDDFFKDNKIKRMLEEKRRMEALQNASKNTPTSVNLFNVGDRIFHEKLGIGHIKDVLNIAGETRYTIDFGAQGIKNLDATYANLKKF